MNRIKGINTAGQSPAPAAYGGCPQQSANLRFGGVLNPVFPHSLDHGHASVSAISLISSINRLFALGVIALALGMVYACTLDDLAGNLPGEQSSGGEPVSGEDITPPVEDEEESGAPDMGSNVVRMQTFIKDIASYARRLDPDFIIIPQNAEELAFKEARRRNGVSSSYMNAISGFGIEELFYNSDGDRDEDPDRLEILRDLKTLTGKIMVADYVSKDSNMSDSTRRNLDEGFIAFPRSASNYDYEIIPADVTNENNKDINNLADAQNYLYLISDGNYDSKEDLIKAISVTNYDVILIDLFFHDRPFTASDIEQMKIKANKGKRLVISYISVGSAEDYRYYWQSGWKKGSPSFLKKEYDGYPDEFWVEYWNPGWRDIIFGNDGSYIKKICDAGFDGAYLDNVEAYSKF